MANKAIYAGLEVPDNVLLKMIPGVNDKYRAGSDGHIYCYSIAKVNAKKPQPFRVMESIGSNGYPFISMILDGVKKSGIVHSMVCSAFHGAKPFHSAEVRHLDGSRTNNNPTNLLWGTRGENEADKLRHGRVNNGNKHKLAKLNDEAVRILRIAIPQGLWNAADASKVFGVDPSVIRNAVNKKTWKHVE